MGQEKLRMLWVEALTLRLNGGMTGKKQPPPAPKGR